jgi:hypothetical protein
MIEKAIEERFMTDANHRIFGVFEKVDEVLSYLSSDDVFKGDITEFKAIGERKEN